MDISLGLIALSGIIIFSYLSNLLTSKINLPSVFLPHGTRRGNETHLQEKCRYCLAESFGHHRNLRNHRPGSHCAGGGA